MKIQLKTILCVATAAFVGAGLCFGATQTTKTDTKKNPAPKSSAPSSLSAKDKTFMKEAAKGGQMEVDMGHMAEKQGKSGEVKKIGSRMVADHTKANNELMAIAKKKGVDLSKEKPKMHKMDDANFDKQYIDMMVKDHEKDLAEFQAEAKNGGDADVKAFASKTSAVIQKHLELVKAAQAKLK